MLVAEGSRVTALLTFSSGKLTNNEATAVWTATSIMEFAGGQVVKTWVNSDALSALTQLGERPSASTLVRLGLANGARAVRHPESAHALHALRVYVAVYPSVGRYACRVTFGDLWTPHHCRCLVPQVRSGGR